MLRIEMEKAQATAVLKTSRNVGRPTAISCLNLIDEEDIIMTRTIGDFLQVESYERHLLEHIGSC